MPHILLVDDDALFRDSLHKTLVRAGYDVEDTSGGTEALKARDGGPSRAQSRIHRPAVPEPHPAANDPVDEPDADDEQRQPGDQDPDPEGDEDE